jgi:pullulanase-type alpha-1,6-glucosidase
LIAWPADSLSQPERLRWRLHWGIEEQPVDLAFCSVGLPAGLAAEYPHLHGYLTLRLATWQIAEEALRGPVVVRVHDAGGEVVAAGGLQISGVLDDLYPTAVAAQLGVTWKGGRPTLRVWAPTARRVSLLLWESADHLHDGPSQLAMKREADGSWAVTGDPDWAGHPYQYLVEVYSPAQEQLVLNAVTDPYSVALTINSSHSLIVDPDHPALRDERWEHAPSPILEHPVDQVAYELHVRDFSIADKGVPEHLRGSFLAFTLPGAGMEHLRRLADAGLTSVQLLPVFDNATAEEHPQRRRAPQKSELRALPPDSPAQQEAVLSAGGKSGFAWGYDPWHYFVPEGSYASSLEAANGPGRIREFRAMVGALHEAGLRVILDMVFNHTAFAGQAAKSVLDRIVPGYYHRLDERGNVESSAAGANVATEHRMAEKLMVDACCYWAKAFKVDGFRFDLMGHHSRANMLSVRRALDALTLEHDGVDGSMLSMYGEGWNFGEVAFNARFVQATQGQLGGTGIGTFSDRLRDAVRGGGWQADVRAQGFGSGLFTDDNGHNGDDPASRLAQYTDLVQLGLAGTLRDFTFNSNAEWRPVRGDQLRFGWSSAGYADAPQEAINYVDVHDNETLFDALTLKLPAQTDMAARVRMNALCLACATLGQSPVLWHGGTDILRSKSFDANSYNSGDWFNYLDFSLTDNGFPAGLPPHADNGRNWGVLRPLLTDPKLKPSSADIRLAHSMALDILCLRASTRLFRLGSAALIRRLVSFPVSGTDLAIPGVIVMRLASDGIDPAWRSLAVVFNATPHPVRQRLPGPVAGYQLHPIQIDGADPVVKQSQAIGEEFAVPGRTAAVFGLPW